MTKEFEIVRIGVEEGINLGSKIKDSLLPNLVLQGVTTLSFNVLQVVDIVSRFYMGHLPMKIKFDANVDCVMSLKWSQAM